MSDRSKIDREEAAARRNLFAQDVMARTGITEAMIGDLVTKFYGRVRDDALLGPVFAVVKNWDEHLSKLHDFWSSVVLTTGRYHGLPMRAHLPLTLIGDHFDRWLDLFEQTAREVCPPAAAAHFIEKARRIADSFEMVAATREGRMYTPSDLDDIPPAFETSGYRSRGSLAVVRTSERAGDGEAKASSEKAVT